MWPTQEILRSYIKSLVLMKFILIPREQDATMAGVFVFCWPILQGISPQVVGIKLLRAAQWLILAHMLKSVILLCFIQSHGKVLFCPVCDKGKWLLYLEFNHILQWVWYAVHFETGLLLQKSDAICKPEIL